MAKSPHTLTTIPKEVLLKILRETDFRGLQTIRKVCFSLRQFVDENSFDLKTKNVFFFAGEGRLPNRTTLLWETWNDLKQAADYVQIESDCRITSSETDIKLFEVQNEHRFDLMLFDLKSLLKNQKGRMDFFAMRVHFNGSEEYHKDFQEFLDKLCAYLASRSEKLKVKKLWMIGASGAQICSILRHLDPNSIENLQIERDRGQTIQPLDISRIVELEHWQRLKTIKIDDFLISTHLQKFGHMNEVTIRKHEFTVVELYMLRQTLQRRNSDFDDITVHFNRLIGHNYLQDFLGERARNVEDEGSKVWVFATQDPKRKLLCLLMEREVAFFYVPEDFENDMDDEEEEEDGEEDEQDEEESEEEEDVEEEERIRRVEAEREADRQIVLNIGRDVAERVKRLNPYRRND